MRLNEKYGKKVEQSEIILPLLDPKTMISDPILPAFSHESISPLALPGNYSSIPTLPHIAELFVRETDHNGTVAEVSNEEVAPEIAALDVRTYFAKEPDVIHDEVDEASSLSPFDPSSYFDK